jgi:hypothetical protein
MFNIYAYDERGYHSHIHTPSNLASLPPIKCLAHIVKCWHKNKTGGWSQIFLVIILISMLLMATCKIPDKYYNPFWTKSNWNREIIPNFLCGHRNGHSLFFTPKGSVYTLFIYTVIMLSSLCTTKPHFVVTSAHTLFGQVCCTTWHYLHTLVLHILKL